MTITSVTFIDQILIQQLAVSAFIQVFISQPAIVAILIIVLTSFNNDRNSNFPTQIFLYVLSNYSMEVTTSSVVLGE